MRTGLPACQVIVGWNELLCFASDAGKVCTSRSCGADHDALCRCSSSVWAAVFQVNLAWQQPYSSGNLKLISLVAESPYFGVGAFSKQLLFDLSRMDLLPKLVAVQTNSSCDTSSIHMVLHQPNSIFGVLSTVAAVL